MSQYVLRLHDIDYGLAVPAVANPNPNPNPLWQVCVRPDTKLLATGGWDRRVRVWQWGKWKPLAVLRYHAG